MQAIEAALDTAGLIIENGGSTVAANRAFAHVLAGYRQEGVTPVWRLDHVIVNAPGEIRFGHASFGRSRPRESTCCARPRR